MSRARASVATLLAALALACTAWLRAPVAVAATDRTGAMPAGIDDWRGIDQPLTERQYQMLETRDVLLRAFTRDQERVLACVAVAGPEQKAAHPPEICYRGLGFTIESQQWWSLEIAGRERPIHELVVEQDGARLLVWSWYRVGSEETASWWREQWLALAARLARRPDAASLLRFSTEIRDVDPGIARQRLAAFLGRFLPAVDRALWPTPSSVLDPACADGESPPR